MKSNLLDDFTEEPEITEESEELLTLSDDEEEIHDTDVDEDRWVPRWKRSNCPKSTTGHSAIKDHIAAKFGRTEYVCEHCAKRNWTPSELEFIADSILREDSNSELCRECWKDTPESLPYGRETGHTEWQLQKDENGDALLNEAGEAVYVGYPELTCTNGHRWYKGEGPRRNINGVNPILFESHIYNRKRREIYSEAGVPDPAYTMDRWGKHPVAGLYIRTRPDGRKTNSPAQRASGSGFYR
jgi:hypothetical protein